MDTKHITSEELSGAGGARDGDRSPLGLPPGLLSAYRVEEALGAGAMGVV